jgi:hypothetical protein
VKELFSAHLTVDGDNVLGSLVGEYFPPFFFVSLLPGILSFSDTDDIHVCSFSIILINCENGVNLTYSLYFNGIGTLDCHYHVT